jgi:hypothetical protein
VGTSHVRAARPCEDAHASLIRDDGTMVLAIADGAGSARRAAAGSTTAVSSSIRCADRALSKFGLPRDDQTWHRMLALSLRGTRRTLERLAASEAHQAPGDRLELRDFATTLSLAVVTQKWVAVAQVGDGAVVLHENEGCFRSIATPIRGEYANETDFMTSDDYLARASYMTGTHDTILGISLMTDGLTMLALDAATNEPFDPFFQPIFAFASQPGANEADLEAFLESERVCERHLLRSRIFMDT